VESQANISTRKLVDSTAEHEVLEDLIEQSKPARPLGSAHHHFLLFTPFRYRPHQHGSRFGRRTEGGIWYGSDGIETAFAECAYYKLLLVAGSTAELTPLSLRVSAFRAFVRTARGVDLTQEPFAKYRSRISSQAAYTAAQRLGRELRADRVEAIRYFSARDIHGGTNIAVISLAAFASESVNPIQTWYCTVTGSTVEFQRELVKTSRFVFDVTDYRVAGKLPAPAP
jgi:hypothetical protein